MQVDNESLVRYSVHIPTLTNVLTLKSFHYFKLYLNGVKENLPNEIPWNHSYEAAIKIYSDTPQSNALRQTIATEHSILYSNREGRSSTKNGFLSRTPEEFFRFLLEYKDTGLIPSLPFLKNETGLEVYTYSVLKDSIRFSRTGKSLSIDFSSKHALHCGASPFVLGAGEFWITSKVLYIDNNSGTFAPPKSALVGIKKLFEQNFPGIHVVTLDYQDPEWKILRSVK